MSSLLSYGEVLIDLLPDTNANSYSPMAGGAPANVAVAFAKLGGSSYFAGGISTDNFGHMIQAELQHAGVNTHYVNVTEQANTALVLVTLDAGGERSFNFYRHETADTHFTKTDVDKINWQEISVFHYCSNTLTNTAMNSCSLYALKKAKQNNTMISFDVNLRLQLWSDLTLLPERVQAAIKLSDIVKFSKDEAQYLAQQKAMEYQSYINELLSFGVKLILITDGANKVQVVSPSFEIFIPVAKINPVDTTAAGDSFIASFLFSIMKQSSSGSLNNSLTIQQKVSDAVVFAVKCGAYTCHQKGAFAALPSLEDI